MITLQKLLNPEDIIQLLIVDNIYNDCFKSNDIYNEKIDFKHHLWFEVIKDNKSMGILWLTDFSHNCVTFHGGLFKEFRGPNTIEILIECLNQIKQKVPQLTLFTTVVQTNNKALKLMNKLNFKKIMTIPNGAGNTDLIVYGESEVIIHG
jgi:hypothetical protein